MARYYHGNSGPYSGKVGGVVGSTWRGTPYIRSLPKRSKKPRHPNQVRTNDAFTLIQNTLGALEDLIKHSFTTYPGAKGTARNSAHSYNQLNAVIETENGPAIDYSRFLFSWGDLEGARETACWISEPGTLAVSWDSSTRTRKAGPADQVFCLIYFSDVDVYFGVEGNIRQDGQLKYNFPIHLADKDMEVMIAFKSPKNGKFSKTQYVGSLNLGPIEEPQMIKKEKLEFCMPLRVEAGVLFGLTVNS